MSKILTQGILFFVLFILLMVPWTKWQVFSRENVKTVREDAGVYWLRVAINGKAFPIQRFAGEDKKGTLYYGKSVNLNGRLIHCFNCFKNRKRKKQHAAPHFFNKYYLKKRLQMV